MKNVEKNSVIGRVMALNADGITFNQFSGGRGECFYPWHSPSIHEESVSRNILPGERVELYLSSKEEVQDIVFA